MDNMHRQVENAKGPVVLVSRRIQYSFPLAFAYLSGYLKEHGEDVAIVFKEGSQEEICKRILDLNPFIVGFGSLYPELKETRELIERLGRHGRCFHTVIGGQMVSPTPEFAVKVTNADFGIVGEGEITLFKLVQALREGKCPNSIGGLAIRDGEKVTLTGQGEYIEDLSRLPPIPYELFPSEKWLSIGKWYSEFVPNSLCHHDDRLVNIHGGRGCPFSCNFCYHHSKPRYRPVDAMLSDTEYLLDKYNANILYFSDDTTIISQKRAKELIDGIQSLKRKVGIAISSRFDILSKMDDDTLLALKEAGCFQVGLGFESGSNRILLDVIGKKISVETMLEGMERLRRVGIIPVGNFMVGQHTETMDDIEATSRFLRRCIEIFPQAEFSFSLTTPFPGSQLYKMIMDKGILKDDKDFYDRFFSDGGNERWTQVTNLTAMSDKEVIDSYSRLQNEYRKLKAKSFGRTINAVYFAHLATGKMKRIGVKAISKMSRRKDRHSKLTTTIESIHSFVQKNIWQKINWKLRGIDKFR